MKHEAKQDGLALLIDVHRALGRAIQAQLDLPEVERERDQWRKKYIDLLNENVKRSGETSALLLMATISGALTVNPKLADDLAPLMADTKDQSK